MHFEKKLNHDTPFEIVEICKLKKVKSKAPFIKSVLYPCESVAILFFIKPVEILQSMCIKKFFLLPNNEY